LIMHTFAIPPALEGHNLLSTMLINPSRPKPQHSTDVLKNNHVLVLAAVNTSLLLWSAERGRAPTHLRFNFPVEVISPVVSLCAFEATDRYSVATGHENGTVCFWEITLDGHTAVCKWSVRPNAFFVNQMALSKGQSAQVLDDSARSDVNLPCVALAFSPGGEKLIASGGLKDPKHGLSTQQLLEHQGCFVMVFGARSGSCLNIIRTNHSAEQAPHYVGMAPDGEGLLIAGRADAQIYTLSGAKCLRRVKLGNQCLFACLSGDATNLVTVCREIAETVQVWNVSGLFFPELEIRRVLWIHMVADVVSIIMDCLR